MWQRSEKLYTWPPYAVQVTASGSGQAGLRVVSHTGQDGRSPPASSGLGAHPGLQPQPGRNGGTAGELARWWHEAPGRGFPGAGAASWLWHSCRARGDLPLAPGCLPPHRPLWDAVTRSSLLPIFLKIKKRENAPVCLCEMSPAEWRFVILGITIS